jgi:hypothetical protein
MSPRFCKENFVNDDDGEDDDGGDELPYSIMLLQLKGFIASNYMGKCT